MPDKRLMLPKLFPSFCLKPAPTEKTEMRAADTLTLKSTMVKEKSTCAAQPLAQLGPSGEPEVSTRSQPTSRASEEQRPNNHKGDAPQAMSLAQSNSQSVETQKTAKPKQQCIAPTRHIWTTNINTIIIIVIITRGVLQGPSPESTPFLTEAQKMPDNTAILFFRSRTKSQKKPHAEAKSTPRALSNPTHWVRHPAQIKMHPALCITTCIKTRRFTSEGTSRNERTQGHHSLPRSPRDSTQVPDPTTTTVGQVLHFLDRHCGGDKVLNLLEAQVSTLRPGQGEPAADCTPRPSHHLAMLFEQGSTKCSPASLPNRCLQCFFCEPHQDLQNALTYRQGMPSITFEDLLEEDLHEEACTLESQRPEYLHITPEVRCPFQDGQHAQNNIRHLHQCPSQKQQRIAHARASQAEEEPEEEDAFEEWPDDTSDMAGCHPKLFMKHMDLDQGLVKVCDKLCCLTRDYQLMKNYNYGEPPPVMTTPKQLNPEEKPERKGKLHSPDPRTAQPEEGHSSLHSRPKDPRPPSSWIHPQACAPRLPGFALAHLLDTGTEANSMTPESAQQLGLPPYPTISPQSLFKGTQQAPGEETDHLSTEEQADVTLGTPSPQTLASMMKESEMQNGPKPSCFTLNTCSLSSRRALVAQGIAQSSPPGKHEAPPDITQPVHITRDKLQPPLSTQSFVGHIAHNSCGAPADEKTFGHQDVHKFPMPSTMTVSSITPQLSSGSRKDPVQNSSDVTTPCKGTAFTQFSSTNVVNKPHPQTPIQVDKDMVHPQRRLKYFQKHLYNRRRCAAANQESLRAEKENPHVVTPALQSPRGAVAEEDFQQFLEAMASNKPWPWTMAIGLRMTGKG